jgi:hypothetical protein
VFESLVWDLVLLADGACGTALYIGRRERDVAMSLARNSRVMSLLSCGTDADSDP